MHNRIAQSNYENDKLSLVQRNPRRVGGAASSAFAWVFFPHSKTGDEKKGKGKKIPFCLERQKPLALRDQS